jgi:integrase
VTLNFLFKPTLKPYSEFDALKIWKKVAEKANIKNTIPRDLRYKAITDMKKAGFNDTHLGHVIAQSDRRTIKRYTHFPVEETKMALQALDCKNSRIKGDGRRVRNV